MSFSDNLESSLKNLEAVAERGGGSGPRHRRRISERDYALAAAPHAEQLQKGQFTSDLLRHATRIGHLMRTKVHIIWLGTTLRLEAREHRLELRPTPDGIVAVRLKKAVETASQKVDLAGNPEKLAKDWLDEVGPPAPPKALVEDDDDEDDDEV